MDVYLVPIGGERYELYCEVPDEPQETDAGPPAGFVKRMKHRFTAMLAEAERQRRHGHDARPHTGWLARVKARSMRWVAEAIAEQRLLWHLRRQTSAFFFHPDDMEEQRGVEMLRRQLRRDFDKHRFWLIIDSLGFIASGALFLVPGPNAIAYYFAFRIVGHYFSLRGARQGLATVAWTSVGSAPLSDLRRVLDLAPELRERRVHDVAHQLNLEHLATFFERTAVRTA
jgi:K+-H+ exchange-related protein